MWKIFLNIIIYTTFLLAREIFALLQNSFFFSTETIKNVKICAYLSPYRFSTKMSLYAIILKPLKSPKQYHPPLHKILNKEQILCFFFFCLCLFVVCVCLKDFWLHIFLLIILMFWIFKNHASSMLKILYLSR